MLDKATKRWMWALGVCLVGMLCNFVGEQRWAGGFAAVAFGIGLTGVKGLSRFGQVKAVFALLCLGVGAILLLRGPL